MFFQRQSKLVMRKRQFGPPCPRELDCATPVRNTRITACNQSGNNDRSLHEDDRIFGGPARQSGTSDRCIERVGTPLCRDPCKKRRCGSTCCAPTRST